MKPVVDGLKRVYEGRVDFQVYADLNADPEASDFARGKGVSAVPTTMLVSPDGRELERWVGSRSEQVVTSAIDAALNSP